MLKINDMSMYIEDEEICINQSLKAHGVCGVMGKYNRLRECFISEFTASLSKYIPGLNVKMQISLNGEILKYKKFKALLNSYTLFHAKDKVEDILYFVNEKLANEVIEDFFLEKYRKLTIGELTPSISNILEMAISICSKSKIIYCYENLDPYKSTDFYIRLLRKYSIQNDSVIFLEAQLFDKQLYDSYIVFENNTISYFENNIDLSTNKICNIMEYDTFMYNTYISKFNLSRNTIRTEVEEFSTEKSTSGSSTDSSFVSRRSPDANIKSLKGFIIYKHKLCVAFLNYCAFFVPDFSKAIILTNTKFNRTSISESVLEYYKNMGNATLLMFFCKHWFSLHVLILQFLLFTLYYSVSVKNTPLLESFLQSKSRKTPLLCKKMGNALEIMIICLILKYLIHRNAHSLVQFVGIFRKEYAIETNIYFSRFISTVAYYRIFVDASFFINEDYTFIKKYLHKSFSSSTYYFYLVFYTFLSSALPFILLSFILNVRFLYIFSFNALFTIPLLNLFRHIKCKSFILFIIIGTTLLYPIKDEYWSSQLSSKILEAFDPFTIVRKLVFCGVNYGAVIKLVFIYVTIFLIFCSLL